MAAELTETCPLCERDGVALTDHHLRLRRRDPMLKVRICSACHTQIHALYPGTQLARYRDLWSLAGLKADPAIQKALVFVRKLAPGDTIHVRQRQ